MDGWSPRILEARGRCANVDILYVWCTGDETNYVDVEVSVNAALESKGTCQCSNLEV